MKSLRTKLVVVGDGACGKTCLLHVFVNGQFPETYNPTIFETYVADIEVEGNQLELALWDTAGQEDYDSLQKFSYPDTDVMILCFSIDSPSSLKNITDKWSHDIKTYCPGAPIIVVGNKKDLRNNKNLIEQLKEQNEEPVSEEQGRLVAENIGAAGYVECSALKNEGVQEVFKMAAKHALAVKKTKQRRCTIL